MNEAYNSQVKKLKFHLNEKTETISLSKLNLQPPVELTQKLQKAREEGEKIRSENPKIIAYGGQETAARTLQQGLDWNKIRDAQIASITRGMETGTISKQRGKERIKTVKGEAESQKTGQMIDTSLPYVEAGADIAGTVADLGLMMSGAGAPLGLSRLGMRASSLGLIGSGARGGVDFYRSAMTSDPEKKAQYIESGLWKTGGAVAAPVIGKTIDLAAKGTKIAAGAVTGTETGKKAIETIKKIPGVQKIQSVGTSISNVKPSDSGGIIGGLAGIAASYNPSDSLPVSVAKGIAGSIIGRYAGTKAIGTLEKAFPRLTKSIVSDPRKEAIKLISKQLLDTTPITQGFRVVAGKTDYFRGAGPRQKKFSAEIPADKPEGLWQPNPEAQGTGLARKGAATQDIGHPPYPETHVGRPDQELIKRMPWSGKGEPPPPIKKVENTASTISTTFTPPKPASEFKIPEKSIILWGQRTKPK
jgi:hypothetical protein